MSQTMFPISPPDSPWDLGPALFLGSIFSVGVIVGAVIGFALESSDHHRFAADAGKAEYYLDPKTGDVEWQWKECSTGSGSLYFQSSPYITQP